MSELKVEGQKPRAGIDYKAFYTTYVFPKLLADPEKAFKDVDFRRKSGRYWQAPCLIHGSDRRDDSFRVNVESLDWKCWSCGEHGDLIGFVSKVYNLGFIQSILYLAGVAEVPLPDGVTPMPPPPPLPERPKTTNLETAPDRFAETLRRAYQICLDNFPGSEGETYLLDRGINAKGIAGYCPDPNIFEKANLDYWAMRDLGLLGSEKDGQSAFARRVIFPYTWKGKLTCLHGRVIDDVEQNTHLRHRYTRSFIEHRKDPSKNIAWPRGVCGEEALSQSRVMVVEAAIDKIAAEQFGYKNVVALGGLNNEPALEALEKMELILLGLDRDEEAGKAVIKVFLPRYGDKIRRVLPPFSTSDHIVKDWAEAAKIGNQLAKRVESTGQGMEIT